ncbi:MAG: NAD(P)/FAD-dependent oxidoreductase [Nitrospiria bacterium]
MTKKQGSSIKVAGAGPSGLTSAICLAKAGYAVEVFEARKEVGGRFIGDFQVIENMSTPEDALQMLKRIGLSSNFYIRPVCQGRFYDYRLNSREVKSQGPFGYFIRRGPQEDTLDRGLLNQALAAGVTLHYKTRLNPEEADIVASGPSSPDGLAKQITFASNLPDTVWVLFDMDISPGAYSYLFVLDGRATFGCAITQDFDHINDYFDGALKCFQGISSFSIEEEKAGYSFMNFSLKPSAKIDRRLYIGEAGGFQDYLFGLGIRYALTTGKAAAESIITKRDYDQLWKKSIGAAQEMSLINRFLYERGGNRGLSEFVRRAGRGDLQDYLSGWYAWRPWKGLLLPLIKWAWREKKRCFHSLPDHWCRNKMQTSTHPRLGPLAENPGQDSEQDSTGFE